VKSTPRRERAGEMATGSEQKPDMNAVCAYCTHKIDKDAVEDNHASVLSKTAMDTLLADSVDVHGTESGDAGWAAPVKYIFLCTNRNSCRQFAAKCNVQPIDALIEKDKKKTFRENGLVQFSIRDGWDCTQWFQNVHNLSKPIASSAERSTAHKVPKISFIVGKFENRKIMCKECFHNDVASDVCKECFQAGAAAARAATREEATFDGVMVSPQEGGEDQGEKEGEEDPEEEAVTAVAEEKTPESKGMPDAAAVVSAVEAHDEEER
jgi:hypothetical protein